MKNRGCGSSSPGIGGMFQGIFRQILGTFQEYSSPCTIGSQLRPDRFVLNCEYSGRFLEHSRSIPHHAPLVLNCDQTDLFSTATRQICSQLRPWLVFMTVFDKQSKNTIRSNFSFSLFFFSSLFFPFFPPSPFLSDLI